MRSPALCGTLIMLVGVCVTFAQNTSGTLRGTLLDPSGARVPSAKIVVEAANFAFQREAYSNDRGEFRIDDLPVATYHITISAHGFADASSDIRVALSSVRDITVALKPAGVRQTVTV